MNLTNKRLSEDEFFKIRDEVLKEWSTGMDVDLKEAVDYLKRVPKWKNFAKVLRKAKFSGITLAQPRAGVALIDSQIELLNFLSKEGGGISYNIPYAKSVSLEKSITDWQYCDRLVGFYEEQGIEINREPFGALTGTLVPPSTSNAVMVIEALLAAEQGVKNITVGYGQCGNLIQDVAAIRALEEQTEEYLKEFGYNDVIVTTVLHQWMGGFPEDEAKAFGIISLGSTIASLSGATKVIVKTPHEAIGIPTKEANAQGIKATKMTLNMLSGQRMPMSKELELEINIIKDETKCILDKILELGLGDLVVGAVKGFEYGIIDVPFAPSKFNYGKMMPARDNDGAVSKGNLK